MTNHWLLQLLAHAPYKQTQSLRVDNRIEEYQVTQASCSSLINLSCALLQGYFYGVGFGSLRKTLHD